MTVELKDIPYEQDFVYEHKRYKQMIRPKKPVNDVFIIACCLASDPCGGLVDFWSNEKVEQMIKIML